MSAQEPAPLTPEQAVLAWVRKIVIGLDLCPFAHRSFEADAVTTVIAAGELEAVLTQIAQELELLSTRDAATGATTLILICQPDGTASIAKDFNDYLDLFAMAEDLSDSLGYSGRVQLASFHPDYVFADAPDEDPANWSNRSPVPVIHLLLEDAVSAAVEHHPDVEGIPERNIARLRELGIEELRRVSE